LTSFELFTKLVGEKRADPPSRKAAHKFKAIKVLLDPRYGVLSFVVAKKSIGPLPALPR
jgi:hypothetical protein